jgi:multicomponent Na+:H+ antiporter subunit D
LAFWFYRAKMAAKPALTLDVDWFYRRTAPWARCFFVNWVNDFFTRTDAAVLQCARKLAALTANPMAPWPTLDADPERAVSAAPQATAPSYDPDRYRPAVALPLLITLGAFVLLLGWYLVDQFMRG